MLTVATAGTFFFFDHARLRVDDDSLDFPDHRAVSGQVRFEGRLDRIADATVYRSAMRIRFIIYDHHESQESTGGHYWDVKRPVSLAAKTDGSLKGQA
jgi:hypothetical protein